MTTSRPQLPNRGLRTYGGPNERLEGASRTWAVRGCESPARPRATAVASLSWAVRSAAGRLRRRAPASATAWSLQRPFSTPSSVGLTSSLPSTVSPALIVSSLGGTTRASCPVLVRAAASRALVSEGLPMIENTGAPLLVRGVAAEETSRP